MFDGRLLSRRRVATGSRCALVAVGCALAAGDARAQCEADEIAKLTASDAYGYDKFGISVSFDGDTLVVGAFGDENETGAAYVFVGEGPGWTEQQKLVPYDGAVTDYFGWTVALDGDTIVVGSRYDDDMGGNSGSAYVYQRAGGAWDFQAKLLADDGEATDQFGYDVAIDGDTIVVGAIGDDDAADRAGAAYVFVRSGTAWSFQDKLTASDGSTWDEFGRALALDGDTLAVGSIGDDDNGDEAGAVYIYERRNGEWEEEAKLLATDGATGDNFGTSVALLGDTLVTGTPGDDDMGSTSGSAYVFLNDGTGWMQVDKLLAHDGSNNAQFGESVSILGDYIAVGAVNESNQGGSAAGSAYVFARNGQSWSAEAKLLASDGSTSDNAGGAVSLSGDSLVVGARNDDDGGNNSGSAYVFRGISDCNGNTVIDVCDIANGTSPDANGNGLPDECDCPADVNGDDTVDVLDLLSVLAAWGSAGGPEDINGDGIVDVVDLLTLLGAWGPC